MGKIALFGAAGAIGNSVAAALRQQNQPYRVVGRNSPELEKSFGMDPLAEIVTWNPDDPASVRAARTFPPASSRGRKKLRVAPALPAGTVYLSVGQGLDQVQKVPRVVGGHLPRTGYSVFRARSQDAAEHVVSSASASAPSRNPPVGTDTAKSGPYTQTVLPMLCRGGYR